MENAWMTQSDKNNNDIHSFWNWIHLNIWEFCISRKVIMTFDFDFERKQKRGII